ncbi:hypothetical protein SAMN06273572_101906 [Monaibacterium marinum]|uniref:Lysophospholipase n=1 Tax=Pontivivens marinum TaxID=1690039 RepID=A0A2C9CP80_9RHOB|nr:DUF1489 domain-containing protein [Monaibacterium marinum]SOH93052.1 hypothetical protein SAMN06273572_101906 [Monaibacterium marinum]
MPTEPLNLIKLCVGAEKVEDLLNWQAHVRETRTARGEPAEHRHVTRMWPKREAELLDGGSLYWVFKGQVLARQQIVRLDEVIGEDGIRRCGIVLADEVIKTEAVPRRPFQGWRYLKSTDAPQDLAADREGETALPPELATALAALGVR